MKTADPLRVPTSRPSCPRFRPGLQGVREGARACASATSSSTTRRTPTKRAGLEVVPRRSSGNRDAWVEPVTGGSAGQATHRRAVDGEGATDQNQVRGTDDDPARKVFPWWKEPHRLRAGLHQQDENSDGTRAFTVSSDVRLDPPQRGVFDSCDRQSTGRVADETRHRFTTPARSGRPRRPHRGGAEHRRRQYVGARSISGGGDRGGEGPGSTG